MKKSDIYGFGYAYGLIAKGANEDDSCGKIFLSPGPENASRNPVYGLAFAHDIIMANRMMTEDLTRELAEILSHIEEVDDENKPLGLEEQSVWWLGYYHAKAGKAPIFEALEGGGRGNVKRHGIGNIRKERGLSQIELADKIGVAQQDISRWELGKNIPSAETLKQIAEALNCKVDDLI